MQINCVTNAMIILEILVCLTKKSYIRSMKYRAYKYRLYPNEEQKILIAKHLGSCRFIYNYALAKKVKAFQTDKTNLSRFDIQADLPIMKK